MRIRAETMKFPVFPPVTREHRSRDGFAQDCLLQQRVINGSVRTRGSLLSFTVNEGAIWQLFPLGW